MTLFPKSARLLKRWEFSQTQARGKKLQGSLLVIHCLEGHVGKTRLGLSVSTRFGNAVKRNRFKRLLREVFRHNKLQLPANLNLLIKPRSAAKSASLHQLQKELLQLIDTL